MKSLSQVDKLKLLGKKIKEIRVSKGITQSDLFVDIDGWFKSNISEIEAGKRNLSTTPLIKITEALNVMVKDLFDF